MFRAVTVIGSIALLASCEAPSGPSTPPPSPLHVKINYGDFTTVVVRDTARAALLTADSLGGVPVSATSWRSDDPAIATIDGSGLITGVRRGSTTIRGSAGERRGSTQVVVAGTVHHLNVTASETWSAADGPHVVDTLIRVGGPSSPVLTIGAGTTVYFKPDAGLDVGTGGSGTLVANGTVGAIVLRGYRSDAPPGSWVGLHFHGGGQSELVGVTVRSCGRTFDGVAGCLVLRHPFFGAAPPVLLVDNVTVEHGYGVALLLEHKSRLATGSARLSVRDMRGYVAQIAASAASAFPAGGSFTNNDQNEVRLRSDSILTSSTWGNLGFAWRLEGRVFVEGPTAPRLTIPAGSTVRSVVGAGFEVGRTERGDIQIGDVAGAPVTMGPVVDAAWVGVHFWPGATQSAISNTVLSDCGSQSNTGFGSSCVAFVGEAAGTGPAPVLKRVTIDRATGVGVVAVLSGRFGTGSIDLVITRTKGAPMELALDGVRSIPPGTYTGNDDDVVHVHDYEIRQSLSLRNIGIPYAWLNGLLVEGVASPVLSVEAGTELRFQNGSGAFIGWFAPGAIRILGSASSPVRLTGHHPSPHPGFWSGLYLGAFALANSLIDHATIEFAGFDAVTQAAAVAFTQDRGPMLTNSTIRQGGGCGVLRLAGAPWITDFTAPSLNNQFIDNVGLAQCGP